MRRRRSVGDTVLRGFGKHRCLTGQEEVDLETEELTDRIAIGVEMSVERDDLDNGLVQQMSCLATDDREVRKYKSCNDDYGYHSSATTLRIIGYFLFDDWNFLIMIRIYS